MDHLHTYPGYFAAYKCRDEQGCTIRVGENKPTADKMTSVVNGKW